ncbi:MAG: hypothetical protein AB7O73_15495 [Bacteroidia bacterium]
MYQLNDTHIDFILNDIRARGVTIEDLQLNLLDHICCIVENDLEESGDFENFYSETIQKFFKSELKELEDETISLIIFKHYYTMKKMMIISGAASAGLLSAGIILKLLHMPGAAVGILTGIVTLSFIFLPLMFILKIKEKKEIRDKVTIGLGTFSGMLLSLGIMFKVFHWPFANIMMQGSLVMLILLFLPFYFITGIRNPETKVNTIVSSIIVVCSIGLLFTLMRSPRSTHYRLERITENFLSDQALLNAEEQLITSFSKDDSSESNLGISEKLLKTASEIKTKLLELETESNDPIKALSSGELVISDHSFAGAIETGGLTELAADLQDLIKAYNSENVPLKLPENDLFSPIRGGSYKSSVTLIEALNHLTLIQRTVLQNQITALVRK